MTENGRMEDRGRGGRLCVFSILLSDWLRQRQAGRAEFNHRRASPAAVLSQQPDIAEGGIVALSLSPPHSLSTLTLHV